MGFLEAEGPGKVGVLTAGHRSHDNKLFGFGSCVRFWADNESQGQDKDTGYPCLEKKLSTNAAFSPFRTSREVCGVPRGHDGRTIRAFSPPGSPGRDP